MKGQLTIDWEAAARPCEAVPRPEANVAELLKTPEKPAVRNGTFPYLPGKPRRGLLQTKVEQFLRDRSIPYVSVDEAKRALFASAKLGAFHYVAYSKTGPNWLIWAAQLRKQVREDMRQWERVFGEGFVAVIARENAKGELVFKKLDQTAVEVG